MTSNQQELQYYWYKPRQGDISPDKYIGKVYGVYYTYVEVDPQEMFTKDLLEVGYLTRTEMLEKLDLGRNGYK